MRLPLPRWTTTIRLVANGPVPVDRAWERYADFSRWAAWSPQIRRVEASTERLMAGATGTVHGWAPLPARFRVTDVDEDARTWSWVVTVDLVPLCLHLHHALVARDDGGSHAELVLRGAAPVVPAYAPLARLALSGLVS